jgi:hypothetical protein
MGIIVAVVNEPIYTHINVDAKKCIKMSSWFG